ncbi:AcrB/AcrD/AcrF family protein [Sphingomonas sp. ASV193]|uniref:AcrB/AcrD/AcrF family protein n=1 Tax=Sphingomonas sp. ASV193 TaxID=3144405 RepID=UPI0032E8F4B7
MIDRLERDIERHWRLIVVVAWLGFCVYFLWQKQAAIHWFALGDTDDNTRMAQVRAWLTGQGWYDLRQHRLDPVHGGANIHWSRLVDLPIAGLILLFRLFVAPITAEKYAAAIAPMIPLLPMIWALALTARRLVGALAVPLTIVALFMAGATLGMVQPLRIDHHGWQLAFLALSLAGLADPDRRRGGLTTGIATALGLSIGLEMIIYMAMMGVAQVLFWVQDEGERERLAAYALSLSVGTTLAFLIFGSNDNWHAVCDALSPVWLSDALAGSALLAGLVFVRGLSWQRRLLVALGAGIVIAAFHALAWPKCLSRLEGISPEADQLWMSHVQEARPIWKHGAETTMLILGLPVAGLIGYAMMAWRARGNGDLQRRILAVAAPLLAAMLLLAWQTRTGPAAQMMSLVGAAGLIAVLVPIAQGSRFSGVRVVATVVAVLAGLGALTPLIATQFPEEKKTAYSNRVDAANRRCPTLPALRPIALQPKGIIFTFVDFGPRIIAMTHHDAITGPYHRNYQAIVDVMKAFRGDAAQAHAIIVDKYRSNYVLICPDQSSATIFRSEAPKGFYVQLAGGKVPSWLQPVDLGKTSPWTMWKVVG